MKITLLLMIRAFHHYAFTLFLVIGVTWIANPSPHANAANSNTNRQLIPLGEREAFLGNAGVGRPDDTGAVYYNPAGLADMGSGRISVTGSVYLDFYTRSDALLYFDNTNVAYQASGFNTIPAFYVASYRLGDWSAALSILVPSSIQIENRVPFATPKTQSNIVQTSRASDLWLGLSLARKLDERWSIGMTAFGVQHQEANSLGLDMQFPAATNTVATTIEQQSLNVLGLSAVLGVSFAAADWLHLGLRAQSALIPLYGKADTYQSVNQVMNGQLTNTVEDLKGTDANYRLPFDFSFGAALTPSSWFALMTDVSLQLGANYQSIPSSNLSEKVNLSPTPRFNAGMEISPTPSYPIRLGFYYDPSATGEKPGTEGFVQEDFYGVTLGLGLNSSRVQTGIGSFYLWSSGKTTPFGAPGTTSAVASHGVGGLLTASYIL